MTYGEERDAEVVDWEEKFKEHLEETRKLERDRQEKIEQAEKKENSWALLRECTSFLRENEKNWKFDTDRPKLKKKQEEKERKTDPCKNPERRNPEKTQAKENL